MANNSAPVKGKVAGKRFYGMQSVMTLSLIIGLLLSAVLAAVMYATGHYFIRVALSDTERRTLRSEEELTAFAEFVESEGISSTDSRALGEWTQSRDASVTVVIHKNDTVLLYTSSGTYRHLDGVGNVGDSLLAPGDVTRTVSFADGDYTVLMFVSFRPVYQRYLVIGTLSAFLLTLFAFSLAFSAVNLRKLRALSAQTAEVAGGNLEKQVSLNTHDEFSTLAEDVDAMRRALVERIDSESRAWQANRDLITSISHDIRTPLTTLLAYSEILADGQYSSREQLQQYSEICRSKSYQLKDLTDQLFSYFLLFGQEYVQPEPKRVGADLFLGQAITEAAAPLTAELGERFVLQMNFAPLGDKTADVDILMFCRVLDNVFSNIRKYADLDCPVRVTSHEEGARLHVQIVNTVRQDRDPKEGSKIGLRTCENLCRAMHIGFSAEETDGEFRVNMTVPLHPPQPNEKNFA